MQLDVLATTTDCEQYKKVALVRINSIASIATLARSASCSYRENLINKMTATALLTEVLSPNFNSMLMN